MRIGRLNPAAKRLFTMGDAHFAGKEKESIETLLIGMEGGLVPLKPEKPRLLEQSN